jgi:hypothetical protein
MSTSSSEVITSKSTGPPMSAEIHVTQLEAVAKGMSKSLATKTI